MAQQKSNSNSSQSGRTGGYQGRDGNNQRGGQGQNQNRRDPARKKIDPLRLRGINYLDYRDIRILERFLNDRGKILPNRITGVTAKFQRKIESSIKHARHLALLPFVAEGLK